jgi:hypothetical protein
MLSTLIPCLKLRLLTGGWVWTGTAKQAVLCTLFILLCLHFHWCALDFDGWRFGCGAGQLAQHWVMRSTSCFFAHKSIPSPAIMIAILIAGTALGNEVHFLFLCSQFYSISMQSRLAIANPYTCLLQLTGFHPLCTSLRCETSNELRLQHSNVLTLRPCCCSFA